MAEPFIGELRMFGGGFAPLGWAFCWGQLMAISENDALYSLIGTTYGGDGQTTFGLPDLRGRVPIHQGPGFTIGQMSGSETVTLNTNQIPSHNHLMMASGVTGTVATPGNAVLANASATQTNVYKAGTDFTGAATLNPQTIALAGGSQPHENMQPYLAVTFIIALFGIYPQRN